MYAEILTRQRYLEALHYIGLARKAEIAGRRSLVTFYVRQARAVWRMRLA